MSDAEDFKARVQCSRKGRIAESTPVKLSKGKVAKCELRRRREDIEDSLKLKKDLEL